MLKRESDKLKKLAKQEVKTTTVQEQVVEVVQKIETGSLSRKVYLRVALFVVFAVILFSVL